MHTIEVPDTFSAITASYIFILSSLLLGETIVKSN